MSLTNTVARRDHPLLPSLTDGFTRGSFLTLVESVAPSLGVSGAAIQTFGRMAEKTRPTDWMSPDLEPICYMAQSEMARAFGRSVARIRAHERELERAGLVERRTRANGSRCGYAGCGIVFTPAIARLEEFRAIRDRLDAERRKAAHLRGRRSAHIRRLKSVVAAIREIDESNETAAALSEVLASWPRADALHRMTPDRLQRHVDEADDACISALEVLEVLEESSGQPPEIERSHIQDTTEDRISPCNAGVPETPPDGGGNETEEREHENAFVENITPERLYRLCSPDMQFYLDARRERHGRLRAHDFASVADLRVAELGISKAAWENAIDKMGPALATTCLIVLAAKAADPDIPILSPGGYLRGMTNAHERGQLHIMGSLIGLSERSRFAPGQAVRS